MTVQLQFFSALRQLNGPTVLEVPDGTTIGQLLDRLYRNVAGLEAWDRHLLIAVGEEYAARDCVLQPGDLVSLMPPVQGG
jgi:molybdopterin converting factor small subunit